MGWVWWIWMGCIGCPSSDPNPAPLPVNDPSPVAHVATRPAPFELVKPANRDPRWANARCNDGSAFSMDVRDQGASTWVIQVTGGYFCDDAQTLCRDRARRLTTTLPEQDGQRRTIQGQGLFSRKEQINPDFHDANHVKFHYCSSDLWLGRSIDRQPTTGSKEGWYFSGHHNLEAGFSYLREHGLEDHDAVLVVGYSAGGAGVVGNFEAMADWLAPQREAGQLKVILDGSWIPPWDTRNMPRADRWGDPHAACATERRARGGDVASCVLGPAWWPHVSKAGVPVLVQVSGLDATQTPAFGVREPAELERWRQGVRASLSGIPWVFSGGRRYHVLSFHERFGRFGPRDNDYRTLVGSFWRGDAPRQVLFGYDRPVVQQDAVSKEAAKGEL
jgi:hypothetical protein